MDCKSLLLPNLCDKILDILQKLARALQGSEMASLRTVSKETNASINEILDMEWGTHRGMVAMEDQVSGRSDPRNRGWEKLFGKPREAHGLFDVVLRLVCDSQVLESLVFVRLCSESGVHLLTSR